MPKLKPDTQRARREHILDAAERCFARAGFHRTTMQDICREAAVSPGALYVYFDSKEALIAGMCERDRAKLADQLAGLSKAPDFMQALAALGAHYALEEPRYKRILHVEMGAESTRNAAVGEIYRSVDRFCKASFAELFMRARDAGRIAPAHDPALLTEVVAVLGDGLFWRRAIDPDFDAARVLPLLVEALSALLKPIPAEAADAPAPGGDAKADEPNKIKQEVGS